LTRASEVSKVAHMAGPGFFSDFFDLFRGSAAGPSPTSAPVPPPARDAPAAPAKPAFDYDDPRIPETATTRIAIVRSLIADIEARAATEDLWSPILLEIRQMGDVHLPSLLQSYIDIPAAHRAEIFRRTGRSASYVLNDGLDKMADRLRAMSLSLAQGNIDAFTSTMRFIDMRYGESQLSPD